MPPSAPIAGKTHPSQGSNASYLPRQKLERLTLYLFAAGVSFKSFAPAFNFWLFIFVRG